MTGRLSPIEAARARHLLADVASRTGIWLPATSGTVTVRCPMPSHGHPDRAPSLRLYLDDGTWYCFACSHRAGDVVQWVSQTEGVDWRRSIEILDSGRTLTNAWTGALSNSATVRHRDTTPRCAEQPDLDRTSPLRVREAVNAAWAYCTTGPRHAQAVAYLAGRRINVTHLEAYTGRKEAGYTPGHGPTITQRLIADGFKADELVDAGLGHRYSDGQITDFYRQRLLIPIRDHTGRVAGLVGRNVGDARWPKYKNPPRTAIYDKAINLYQPLPAPSHPDGRVVVVEGTLDALAIAVAAAQAGETGRFCPVTQSGRELSPGQLRTVIGMHPRPPVVALDGDSAGRESTRRIRAAAALLGVEMANVELPDGEDPASWLAGRPAVAVSIFAGEGGEAPRDRARVGTESESARWGTAAVRLRLTIAAQRSCSPATATALESPDRGPTVSI